MLRQDDGALPRSLGENGLQSGIDRFRGSRCKMHILDSKRIENERDSSSEASATDCAHFVRILSQIM